MTIARRIVDLQAVLLDRARAAGDVYLPGYTHLQRAQPVLLAHHLLAHGWALGRDVERILEALERIDVSPLGAGALAGSSLPLDPDFTARKLGFCGALRELARRGRLARPHRRGIVRADDGGHRSVAHRRGVRAVDDRGVRVRTTGRRLRDRLVDAAAEEEPRHRRTGAGQGRAADRQPHRLPGHDEGPAVQLQPRLPGGQGAAVRLGRPGSARARCGHRDDRHRDMGPRTDAGCCGRRGDFRDGPRRMARAAGHAVPRGARDHRHPRPPIAGRRRIVASLGRSRSASRPRRRGARCSRRLGEASHHAGRCRAQYRSPNRWSGSPRISIGSVQRSREARTSAILRAALDRGRAGPPQQVVHRR